MKKATIAMTIMVLCGMCVILGCKMERNTTTDFTIETIAMTIGYDMRDNFVWTPSVDFYYNAIMAGEMSINAAKLAEGYLRERTHPIIANRLVSLAGKVGFDLNESGNIVGVDAVDIHLLQVAATGFKQGLMLN